MTTTVAKMLGALATLLLMCVDIQGSETRASYLSTVMDEDVKKTPSWDKHVENPPLSARKAIKLATDLRMMLVKDSDDWQWRFKGLTLIANNSSETPDKWYWMATFQASPAPGHGLAGMPPSLSVYVLMDGTVIKPVVTDRTR
jgi:hypothetical protein